MLEDNAIVALGRKLGQAEEFEEEGEMITFYGFTPVEGCKIPAGDITIDFVMGTVMTEDQELDLVECVTGLPRLSNTELGVLPN